MIKETLDLINGLWIGFNFSMLSIIPFGASDFGNEYGWHVPLLVFLMFIVSCCLNSLFDAFLLKKRRNR